MEWETREKIIGRTREFFDVYAAEAFEDPVQFRTRGCLGWALCTMAALKEAGLHMHAELQAGSAYFMYDDGHPDLAAFGYTFDPMEAARSIVAGSLPEMHVWVALFGHGGKDRAMCVDASAGFQRQRAVDAGMPFPEDQAPPEFIFHTEAELLGASFAVRYVATKEACALVKHIAMEHFLDFAIRKRKEPRGRGDVFILEDSSLLR